MQKVNNFQKAKKYKQMFKQSIIIISFFGLKTSCSILKYCIITTKKKLLIIIITIIIIIIQVNNKT